MIQPTAGSALALPVLSRYIPVEMYVPGENALVAPLAIALLEANVITDAMLQPGPNAKLVEVLGEPDERELSMLALTNWWTDLQKRYPTKHFHWHLHVQELNDTPEKYAEHPEVIAWFCLTRNQSVDIPRFTLARRTEKLEAVLEGFGQTVLAVLFDASMLLPDSFTPWRAVDWADWLHWEQSNTDEELLEQRRVEEGYQTTQEVIDNCDIMTRAEFYAAMPKWVTAPRRVVSRKKIVCAAHKSFEKSVIAACDAIAELVADPGFRLRAWDVGVHRCGLESIDGSMVLLWRENDPIGRVIDDALEMMGQAGEYCDFIDTHPVPLTAHNVLDCQARTEQMLQLAVRTERLLDLIGEPL